MESFTVTTTFPISAQQLYDAWLDAAEHSAFTGADAAATAEEGAEFMAWDGYIWGKNVELEQGERIVQTWRTTEFDETDEDSTLELLFEDTDDGSRLTLNHSNIPEGQGQQYEQGWEEHYFQPMREYFSQ